MNMIFAFNITCVYIMILLIMHTVCYLSEKIYEIVKSQLVLEDDLRKKYHDMENEMKIEILALQTWTQEHMKILNSRVSDQIGKYDCLSASMDNEIRTLTTTTEGLVTYKELSSVDCEVVRLKIDLLKLKMNVNAMEDVAKQTIIVKNMKKTAIEIALYNIYVTYDRNSAEFPEELVKFRNILPRKHLTIDEKIQLGEELLVKKLKGRELLFFPHTCAQKTCYIENVGTYSDEERIARFNKQPYSIFSYEMYVLDEKLYVNVRAMFAHHQTKVSTITREIYDVEADTYTDQEPILSNLLRNSLQNIHSLSNDLDEINENNRIDDRNVLLLWLDGDGMED